MQRLVTLFLIVVSLLLAGCELFTTREPEPPDSSGDNFEAPTTPEVVITNLTASIAEMNTQNYLQSLSDPNYGVPPFTFVSSPSAATQYPELQLDWNKSSEERYLRSLFAGIPETGQPSLRLSNLQSSVDGDTLLFTAGYSLTVPHNDSSFPILFEGELKFKMVRDSRSLYSIFYWQDNKVSTSLTWSDLKGYYYQ